MSLDDFIYKWGGQIPQHIKIDVDGNEEKILDGMTNILNDKKLNSIAIEANLSLKTDHLISKSLQNVVLNNLQQANM